MVLSDLSSLIAAIRDVVGESGIITDAHTMEPYLLSWRDNWTGTSPLIVRPTSTEAVAAVVRLCAAAGMPIVPQGGRTGVTGASQPHADNSEIVLSLERMNRIRSIDVENDTMVVDAGCVLGNLRDAAAAAGRLFPLYFGSVGSCQIGGNISTNAGGVNVVRYGNTRNLIAGLEVVLPDGRVWDGLRGLRKDNAGYDLKQLFIGAEGTLGIITGAVIRLFPAVRGTATALVAAATPDHLLRWLLSVRERVHEQITAAELIQRSCIEITCQRIPGTVDALPEPYPWYMLIELSGHDEDATLRDRLEELFAAGFERGDLLDGVIASTGQQAEALWRMRESIPEAHKQEGTSYKHDISVPLSKVATFLAQAEQALTGRFPGIRMFAFGHLGDGNIHFNPLRGDANAPELDLAAVNRIVHDLVVGFGGSISAEHGVGRLRREELLRYKSETELQMMAAVKRAFDPANLMNPGKVIPERFLKG
jgi:FAD/FMN-containing dehydrogenase